jgi:methionine sulfoxide reductase heme-binding subunit
MSGRGTAAQRVIASYVHRLTASLGLAALLAHVLAILADSFARVGWVGALVPFSSAYRPMWVGLGTLGVYTFLLVAAVGFARGRFAASALGARVWRGLHGLAYVGWSLAMLHGLNSGTDSGKHWVQALYIGCGVAVAGASIARATGFAPRERVTRGWDDQQILAGHR